MTNLDKIQTAPALASFSADDVRRIVGLKKEFQGMLEGYAVCLHNSNSFPSPKFSKFEERVDTLLKPLRGYAVEIRKYPEFFENEIIYIEELIGGLEIKASEEMIRYKRMKGEKEA